jgi:hypothetical protein
MYLKEKLKAEIVAEAPERNGKAISKTRDGQISGGAARHTIKLACEAFRISQGC